jgi:hypothetical protein
MTFFSGRHGSLQYLGKPVAKVRNWNLSFTAELLDTTTVDLIAPTYRPGRKSATGGASLFYYRPGFRDRTEVTSFEVLLQRLMRVGALDEADQVSLELAIGGTTADRLLLNAFLTQASVGSQSGEVSTLDVQFTMTGDLQRGLG